MPASPLQPGRPRKVLIANRGEIAVRIARTLRDLGIRAVAVHAADDLDSPHVRAANEAYSLGGSALSESYLDISRVLDVARRAGCDALHPGYGFLSESADFAEACQAAGLVFIGPPAAAIRVMGGKVDARRAMQGAGVPIVPGGPAPDVPTATATARQLGFPVLLKATAGGGGKGMRRVDSEKEMASAFERAKAEAKAAFGNDDVYVEKLLVRPRHVEIQVLGDRHGNVVHLGERDCSLQRRHQKVVEESPCPALDRQLVEKMGDISVQGAKSIGYFSAGTFEYLVDPSGRFYFLEMNTRLQVEHGVTELCTGLDLVEEMVRVAAGETLGFDQSAVNLRGAAIECRVYAEDPEVSFLPSPGKLGELVLPEGPGVRNDVGVDAGGRVSDQYDPLLGKLMVWGNTRAQAVRRLRRALSEYRVTGVRTNLTLLRNVAATDEFARGDYDIEYLEREVESLAAPRSAASADEAAELAAVAALVWSETRERRASNHAEHTSQALSPWVLEHRRRSRQQHR